MFVGGLATGVAAAGAVADAPVHAASHAARSSLEASARRHEPVVDVRTHARTRGGHHLRASSLPEAVFTAAGAVITSGSASALPPDPELRPLPITDHANGARGPPLSVS
jgi:hypothetical protein